MLALYLLSLLAVLSLFFRTLRVHRTAVPGPWYTKLTSLVLKYHEFTRNRRLWIHNLHKAYGTVVRLAPNEVSFSNLDGVKEIYQSGGSGYDKTEFYGLFRQYNHRTMFSTLNKHDHSQRRRLFADRYAMTNIVSSPVMDGIRQRAAQVVAKCRASIGGHLDIYGTLHCYALDCASHFLFNPGGTQTLNEKDVVLMEELSHHDSLKQRVIQHYWPWLNTILTFYQPRKMLLSQEFVLDRTLNSQPHDSSLLSKLQSKSADLERVQMAAECMDHMAAGIETTGDSLCFLMHELSLPRSRRIQEKLRHEARQNLDKKTDELPYLDAVIKEGLRLFAPIPMSLPRYVPLNGRTIAGYTLPAGEIVSCQAYSVHRLNEGVFPHAEEYWPERWLEQEGELERNRLFFAFAAGGRGCIGRNLAVVEMKTLLRELYSKFTTTVSEEMKGDMSIDDQIIASRPKDQTCLLSFSEATAWT
ncbi:cytochrome P450 monooxygenase [Aspergillus steynii IBT 23096]|uniref:Cytochrome P450 monooxygenase n=1 Tax=Aspergillus steynii IBT 23096 TaxID=1392250 RepID=A0A2I2G388_9EURO|nr:cytochrome P450 monooxygenase [Aspergillus steynii IBT 23096]PLB47344.1 cytochrome P450 monooxygenase [Aspergillus steynii IBT 23096]